jgi:hypothetical protein
MMTAIMATNPPTRITSFLSISSPVQALGTADTSQPPVGPRRSSSAT